ncbi:hypothetical protein K402DRAFT_221825 [Aulographum hederae CBS 113979]|uniref:Uncharacterized protein n=1 Tax=Aulographum hederae CBS 113979 TaxID=1176131 RepID=A0A6G1GL89_9PEZI|nr:hypothetical protein K402DRAFT_221825 [Aulographum hederae CBS 113979]
MRWLPPGSTESTTEYYDVVSTWKGLSMQQAAGIRGWDKVFQVALHRVMQGTVLEKVYNLLPESSTMPKAELLRQVGNLINKNLSCHTFMISASEVLEEMMNILSTCSPATFRANLEDPDFDAFLHKFIDACGCFTRVAGFCAIQADCHASFAYPANLQVNCEVLHSPPKFAFSDLQETVLEGSCVYLRPVMEEAFMTRRVPHYSKVIKHTFRSGHIDLAWDPSGFFRGKVLTLPDPQNWPRRYNPTDDEEYPQATVDCTSVVQSTFPMSNSRFEQTVRYRLHFKVIPQARPQQGVDASTWPRPFKASSVSPRLAAASSDSICNRNWRSPGTFYGPLNPPLSLTSTPASKYFTHKGFPSPLREVSTSNARVQGTQSDYEKHSQRLQEQHDQLQEDVHKELWSQFRADEHTHKRVTGKGYDEWKEKLWGYTMPEAPSNNMRISAVLDSQSLPRTTPLPSPRMLPEANETPSFRQRLQEFLDKSPCGGSPTSRRVLKGLLARGRQSSPRVKTQYDLEGKPLPPRPCQASEAATGSPNTPEKPNSGTKSWTPFDTIGVVRDTHQEDSCPGRYTDTVPGTAEQQAEITLRMELARDLNISLTGALVDLSGNSTPHLIQILALVLRTVSKGDAQTEIQSLNELRKVLFPEPEGDCEKMSVDKAASEATVIEMGGFQHAFKGRSRGTLPAEWLVEASHTGDEFSIAQDEDCSQMESEFGGGPGEPWDVRRHEELSKIAGQEKLRYSQSQHITQQTTSLAQPDAQGNTCQASGEAPPLDGRLVDKWEEIRAAIDASIVRSQKNSPPGAENLPSEIQDHKSLGNFHQTGLERCDSVMGDASPAGSGNTEEDENNRSWVAGKFGPGVFDPEVTLPAQQQTSPGSLDPASKPLEKSIPSQADARDTRFHSIYATATLPIRQSIPSSSIPTKKPQDKNLDAALDLIQAQIKRNYEEFLGGRPDRLKINTQDLGPSREMDDLFDSPHSPESLGVLEDTPVQGEFVPWDVDEDVEMRDENENGSLQPDAEFEEVFPISPMSHATVEIELSEEEREKTQWKGKGKETAAPLFC